MHPVLQIPRTAPLRRRSSPSRAPGLLSLVALCGVAGLVGLEPASAFAGPSLPAPPAAADVQVRRQAEQAQLEAARAALPAYFQEAYQRHARIPAGLLEALAFTGSRWVHLRPALSQNGELGVPRAHGVMGLYHGEGFRDVLSEAADALRVPVQTLLDDPRAQILATAALLERYMQEAGMDRPLVEELGPVLERLSGLPGRGQVGRFAQQSYVYDVLLTLDRGHDDHGIRIPARPITWELVFDAETLELLRAPMVRIDVDEDLVRAADGSLARLSSLPAPAPAPEPAGHPDEAGAATRSAPATTDYPPALWVASPNYSSRNGSAITHVAIHTVQGSYSGAISWCQNPDSDVSAHYIMRSSDGQVTQMVREYDKAWHVGSENPYTIGIEHEGYVDTSSYYTTAMYNSSSALTKDICTSNKIDCTTCYGGASSSTTQVLSNSYHVKGHQHYQNQTHTDPGIYWDWARYKTLVGGGSSGGSGGTGTTTILDSFEASEGHFNTSPTYSGTTTGISTSSTAERSTAAKKNGAYSERLTLLDNTSSSSSWQVRFLSASGSPSSNVSLTRAGGALGFWAYSTSSGITLAALMDDSDGLEVSSKKSLPTGAWTYFEWKLDDAAQWDAWYAGNGALTASAVTLDALMIYRAQTSSTVYLYIDDVQYKK